MAQVTMYTTAVCPYYINAKQLLAKKGVVPEEIRVDTQPHLRQEMMAKSGQRTVPQIWISYCRLLVKWKRKRMAKWKVKPAM